MNPDIWKGIRNLPLSCAAGAACASCSRPLNRSTVPPRRGLGPSATQGWENGRERIWCFGVKGRCPSLLSLVHPKTLGQESSAEIPIGRVISNSYVVALRPHSMRLPGCSDCRSLVHQHGVGEQNHPGQSCVCTVALPPATCRFDTGAPTALLRTLQLRLLLDALLLVALACVVGMAAWLTSMV